MPVASMLMGSLGGSGGGGGVGQAASSAASGLLSAGVGYFQRKKAKRELGKLQRPAYEIPQEIQNNQKMAEQAANEGLPSQQYNNAMKNIQRNQANLLAGSMSRRSALMALPKLQQQSNDATGNLDAQDAMARMQNQKTLYGIGAQTAQYKDKAYNINKLQPYQENKDYYQSLLGAGNQNLLAGADKLLGGAGQLAFGGGGSTGGGSTRGSTQANTSAPSYYNWYGSGSDYSSFVTPFG